MELNTTLQQILCVKQIQCELTWEAKIDTETFHMDLDVQFIVKILRSFPL